MDWVVEMAPSAAGALTARRLEPMVEAGLAEDRLWLRGELLDKTRRAWLSRLPCDERYTADRKGLLTPWGSRLPTRRMPEIHWMRLKDFLPIVLPDPAMPGQAPATAPFGLVRGGEQREANLLVLSARVLAEYVEGAPQLRLRHLRYALNDQGRCLVLGRPLPPLAGERWATSDGVAAPGGYAFEPASAPLLLRRKLNLQSGGLLLCHPDGRCESIPADAILPLSRSGIRRAYIKETGTAAEA